MKGKAKPPKTPDVGGKDRGSANNSSEFVPGVSEADWDFLQGIDERDSFIAGLVGSLVEDSLNTCQARILKQQASAYAADIFCQILECTVENYFLSTDLEFGRDEIWAEDEPPKVSIIDSWMSNKVPVIRTPTDRPFSRLSASTSSTLISEEQLQNTPNTPEFESPIPPPKKLSVNRTINGRRKDSPKIKKGSLTPSPLLSDEAELLLSPVIPPSGKGGLNPLPKIQKYGTDSFRGSVKAASKHLVEYDEVGNVISVAKIGVDQLPRASKNRTSYKIESPSSMSEASSTSAPPALLNRPRRITKVRENNKPVKCNTQIITHANFPCGVSMDEIGPRAIAKGSQRSPRVVDLAPIRMVNRQKVKPSDIVTS
ncbi:Oidioi.mRNA.OKI2018_I69.XSR.g16735.t1.cds [Oikopleura dioica]|uniref:Oidioi.mRNA.OKI2018_I69.XSR.g16735.t1.cds n=1 Tax=Oikopleura dioica TaxID=34765 RepID=A0ABN7SKZ6_OIKDI|nr:Oidioi.mRNA.OKI2018_I69.XSR.g16735.t1.cds [Oikopleura dioica]